MRTISLISILIFLVFNIVHSQVPTFNSTFNFGYPVTIFRDIIVTDSCIYASGLVLDSISPYNTGALFVKFGLNGEPLIVKTLTSSSKNYLNFEGIFLEIGDMLIRTGHTEDFEDPIDTYKLLLMAYNHDGDTIFTKEYASPYHDDFRSGGVLKLDSRDLLLSGYSYNGNNYDAIISKVDSLGNLIWTQVYPGEFSEMPGPYLAKFEGNSFMIGGSKNNYYQELQNFIFRNWIMCIDSIGHIQWTWESSNDLKLSGIGILAKGDNSSYIGATGIGTEKPVNAFHSQMIWDGYIYKLNSDFEQEWVITFKDSIPGAETGLGKILSLSDNGGYLACGAVYEITPPGFNINGWVVKFTEEGDSIWSRYFHYWDTPYDLHYFSDMEQMPDGGVLLCGQAYSGNAGTQQQLGWLVKLDEYGCLVPGCQLVATEDIGKPQVVAMRLYPNPASDILNIYTWSPHTPKNALLRIVSSDGQVVRESPVTRSDMTSMIPVRDLAAGVYFVQYVEGGVVVATEEAVIAQ